MSRQSEVLEEQYQSDRVSVETRKGSVMSDVLAHLIIFHIFTVACWFVAVVTFYYNTSSAVAINQTKQFIFLRNTQLHQFHWLAMEYVVSDNTTWTSPSYVLFKKNNSRVHSPTQLTLTFKLTQTRFSHAKISCSRRTKDAMMNGRPLGYKCSQKHTQLFKIARWLN